MNEPRKSDSPIVPMKSPNKAGQPVAEEVEGRGLAKGTPPQQNAPRTQCRTGARSALERVRQAASKDKKLRFTALLHHISLLSKFSPEHGSVITKTHHNPACGSLCGGQVGHSRVRLLIDAV